MTDSLGESLDQALEANRGVLYCKLHPGDRAGLPDLSQLSCIRILPSNADPYPLLRHTHALISDYSSIFFDYLLLDRPLVFYPYDLEAYRTRSRGLYDDYHHVTPGPKASTSSTSTVRKVLWLVLYARDAGSSDCRLDEFLTALNEPYPHPRTGRWDARVNDAF